MTIPARDLAGVRQTVNANLSTNQTVWNLRSAFNVGALNCLDPEYAAIIPNYQQFLERHSKELRQINRDLLTEFKARYGKDGLAEQDVYMTSVYNYFALPPVQEQFCDAVLTLSTEAVMIEPNTLETFAGPAMTRVENVFDNFYGAYEQYQLDLAAWEATFGPTEPVETLLLDETTVTQALPAATTSPLPTEGPILPTDTNTLQTDVPDGSGSTETLLLPGYEPATGTLTLPGDTATVSPVQPGADAVSHD